MTLHHRPARLTPELAANHHLLLVTDYVTPDDVEALALSRFAGASRRDEHTIDLLPQAWLTGPWALDEDLRAVLGVPPEATDAYLARAPVHRAAPVPPELRGLGGLLDAFAEGTPEGTEADVVDFLFAAARRLGGGFRAGGSGVVLVPDPAQTVDLLVHSPVWLEPEALKLVLEPVLPALEVFSGTPAVPLPVPPPAPEGLTEQEQRERAELHTRADAFDAEALAAEQVYEGYDATWSSAELGVISVQVDALHEVPTVLLAEDWADQGLLTYALRWYPRPDDGVAPPATDPYGGTAPAGAAASTGAGSGAGTRPPDEVRWLIEAGAKALLDAVGGEAADDDGFLVDLS